MTPELRALLLADDPGSPTGTALAEPERFLLRHLAVVAAVLTDHADLYRRLLARRRAGTEPADLRTAAHDAAHTIAAVNQSLARRPWLLAATLGGPLDPTPALLALDQLFFGLILLTGRTDDDALAPDPQELDLLLQAPSLRQWLARIEGTEPAVRD
jgi:hypothetical protein